MRVAGAAWTAHSETSSDRDQMGIEKVYMLDDLSHDGERWQGFVSEVFHYTIRISDTTFS